MALFDPATGKVTDRDALRSLQFQPGGPRRPRVRVDRAADAKHVEIVNELTGGTTGRHTFHGDGRVDANVTPSPAVADAGDRG